MDILQKSLEIWKNINDSLYCTYEKRFVFHNKYIGKEMNCLLCVPQSVLILDGNLNQLHIIRNKDKNVFHQTILMTPQPLEQFTRMELSSSELFMALIGKDSVSLLEMCSIYSEKTCKKIKEIYNTKDEVVDVKWYPKIHDYLIILNKQSIHIFHIHSNLKATCIYQHHLYEQVNSHSTSFGIKEEYIGCDFGSASVNIDDNNLFLLKDSGEIYLLPELRKIHKDNQITPTKIFFDPPSHDNYQDDFTSIIVLKGLIDIIVLANNHGTIQHALYIDNRICVYETITIEVATEVPHRSEISLIADETAYPPRYFLVHSAGIQSCILPWIVYLRQSLRSSEKNKLENSLSTAENTIFDPVIQTYVSEMHNLSQVRFAGLTVIREASSPPEMCIMQCRENKQLVKIKLRPESLFMINGDINVDDNITPNRDFLVKQLSESKFLSAFKAEISKVPRMPTLNSGITHHETPDQAKLNIVLKMNNIAEEHGACLSKAGEIFDHKIKQINSVAFMQKEQLNFILKEVDSQKEKSNKILKKYERAFSRQQSILNRLSECSEKLSEINGVASKADKESTNMIINAQKRLTSMNALLRSCKLRYSQFEDFIDTETENSKIVDMSPPFTENLKEILSQEDSDISGLIADVRSLLTR